MSRGDGEHSFGHGSACYWCDLADDDPAIEQRCDERSRQKPTEAEALAYRKRGELGERVGDIASDYGFGLIDWDEMIRRIEALNATPTGSENDGQ